MASSAIERTSRALDLIPFIVDRPGISIEELAMAFRTTEAEISETLNIVFMCGLPGYTPLELIDLSTDEGEVSIIDPQNLDKPRRLTQLEVISIILGVETLKAQGISSEVIVIADSLISKLSNLLEDIRDLRMVETSRQIEHSPWRKDIETAIREKQYLQIDYVAIATDSLTTRNILPVRLYSRGGFLYMEAIAQENGELRNFRLDRLRKISQRETQGVPTKIESFMEVQDDIEVHVLIPAESILFLEKNQTIIQSVEDVGHMRKVVFQVSQTKWLLRALASINGEVVILQPESMSREFASLAQMTLKGYEVA
jgi:proteasome accessory factor C